MIKANVINNITEEALLKQINEKIKNASAVLVNETARVSAPFVPYLSGSLYDNMKFEKKGDRFIGISYNMPYAKRIWYGDPNWNYTKETHPQACPRWIIRAFKVYKNEIMKSVVEAFNEV